jgi:hypothetical protein
MRALFVLPFAFVSSLACATTVKPQSELVKSAPAAFPYGEWDHLLTRFVDDRGRVDYNGLRTEPNELARFERLFAAVAGTGPKQHPEQFRTNEARLAYYINAYNILVWKSVLGRLPKLRNVDSEKISFFFWTKFVVDGQSINLKDLESAVIRPTFHDARVHMALNCASGGCPLLPQHAFLPDRLDQQLSTEARKFCNEKRNVDFDAGSKRLRLSHIFDWYKDDFGGTPAQVVTWINHYREPATQIPLDAKVEYVPYDWTLNDVHILQR